MSGTVGLGALDLSAAKLYRRHDRRPDLVVASAGRDFGPRLTGCLFPPGSPGITAPWAGLPSPPPSLARYHRSAVTQYYRIHGRHRRACAQAGGHGPRDVRFVRRMRGPARVPRNCRRDTAAVRCDGRATEPAVTTPRTRLPVPGCGHNRAFCRTPSKVIHSLWAAVQEINYKGVSRIRPPSPAGWPGEVGLHSAPSSQALTRSGWGLFVNGFADYGAGFGGIERAKMSAA